MSPQIIPRLRLYVRFQKTVELTHDIVGAPFGSVLAYGNILYFISKLNLKGVKATMVEKNLSDEIGVASKNSVETSESMISKVFGYFFGQ